MQTTCSPIELRAHARLDDAASRCTPDSVLPGRPSSHARARRHLSLRVRGGGSSLGGCNPPSWSPLRREQTAPAGTACPTRLAPRQPAQSPGRRHYCRRRWALTPPFHPSPVQWELPLPSAGLLSVAVLRHQAVTNLVPHLAVSVGGLPVALKPQAGSREVPLPRLDGTATAPLLAGCRAHARSQVGRRGLEPRTPCLKGRYSTN